MFSSSCSNYLGLQLEIIREWFFFLAYSLLRHAAVRRSVIRMPMNMGGEERVRSGWSKMPSSVNWVLKK
jgi:hypothetical protein